MNSNYENSHGTIKNSKLEAAYANVFELLISRGELTLLFGNVKAVDNDKKILSAELENRIILSPYIAKRLASLLNNKVREYETVFGFMSEEVQVSTLTEKPSPHEDILQFSSEIIAEKADFLLRQIGRLDVEFGMERSFKISDRSLFMNRFIVGFKKNDLVQGTDETLISIFKQMGMPDRFREDCLRLLHKAEFVHFGFEEQQNGCLYKAYLEFKTELKFAADGTRVMQDPFLVFLGFKWNPFDNTKCALSRYTCYPLLSLEEIQERLSRMSERNQSCKSFETTMNILNAAKIISNNKIIYEEVSEENNPRKSFDMNLYGANMQICDIYPYLMDIGRHYCLPLDRYVPLCERIKDKKLGHLSGGIDREGNDFLTVYYGVEGINGRNLPRAIVATS